jgi:hypothetical protein
MDKKARQLQADWEALLKKHSKPLERGAQAFGVKTYRLKPKVEKNQEELQKIRSLVTPGGDTPKSPPKIYSGDKMIGIAVAHKSCLVPIFSKEQAQDMSKMRR